MRSTVRIDDDLLSELRERARRERIPLTQMLNRTLRAGLRARSTGKNGKAPYRQTTFSMGEARINLDKALALAGELEVEEIVRKLAMRK